MISGVVASSVIWLLYQRTPFVAVTAQVADRGPDYATHVQLDEDSRAHLLDDPRVSARPVAFKSVRSKRGD